MGAIKGFMSAHVLHLYFHVHVHEICLSYRKARDFSMSGQGRSQPVNEVFAKNGKVGGRGLRRKAPVSGKQLDFIKVVNNFYLQINARYIPYL